MKMILNTGLLFLVILLFVGSSIVEIRWLIKSRKPAGTTQKALAVTDFDFGSPLALEKPLAMFSSVALFSAALLNPDVAIRDLFLPLPLVVLAGRNFRMLELRRGRSGELSLTLVAVLAFVAGATA